MKKDTNSFTIPKRLSSTHTHLCAKDAQNGRWVRFVNNKQACAYRAFISHTQFTDELAVASRLASTSKSNSKVTSIDLS